jgi:alkylation response protein AidB-like acyl-CoA dehydrogenase
VDFGLTTAETAFRDDLRAFLRAHVPAEPLLGFDEQREWQRLLHRNGWMAPHWPAEYGGRGASVIEFAIYVQEMAAARAPQIANRVGVQTVGPVLIEHGSPEQKARLLPRILSADDIWCQLFSEPDAGSDLASLRTTATLDGDVWRVRGQKVWTSYGAQADLGLLLARTEPHEPGSRGLTVLLADLRRSGAVARPLTTMTGEAEFAEVFLDDLHVDADAVVGTRGDGWRVANSGLASERGVAFPLKEQAVLRTLLDGLVAGARDGRDGRRVLGAHDRQRLADDVIRGEVFRLVNLRTLTRMARGDEVGAWTSLVKLCWADVATHLSETAWRLDGRDPATPAGAAATRAMLWYRSAPIAGGTSEIQRNIVGERLLGLPREPRAGRP